MLQVQKWLKCFVQFTYIPNLELTFVTINEKVTNVSLLFYYKLQMAHLFVHLFFYSFTYGVGQQITLS